MNGWSFRGIEPVLETVEESNEEEMNTSSGENLPESFSNEKNKLEKLMKMPKSKETDNNGDLEKITKRSPNHISSTECELRSRSPFHRIRSSSDPTDFLWLERRRSLPKITDDIETKGNMEEDDAISPHNFNELHYQNNSSDSHSSSPEDSPQFYKCILQRRSLPNAQMTSSDCNTAWDAAAMEQVFMYIPRKYSTGSHPYVNRISRTVSQTASLNSGAATRRATFTSSSAFPSSRPRMGRRGSEVPALSSLARLRRISNQPSYPVGLKRRGSRGFSNTDFQISTIQAKAKNEMLANLVLPVLSDTPNLVRERRVTCHYYSPSLVKSKKDEKRLRIAKEILDTEKKYLASLTTLQKVFEEPLRLSSLISPKELNIVFPKELDHIRLSHTLFMKDLEERVHNWKLQGIVGDIFTKLSSSYHIDVLRIYSTYVNNFPKAIAVINKCSRNSQKFRKFIQNCSAHHECEGLDLPAFLLTPIQRLPRYVLLLRQMSKNTDSTHPDSFHITNALETMKQMINVLNDSIQNSCKLAHSSTLHKNVKRRKLRKRSTLRAMHQSMKETQDQVSSGPLLVDSNQSSLSAVPGASVETADQHSPQVTSCQDSEEKIAASSTNHETDRLQEEAPPLSPFPSVQLRIKNKEKKQRPLSSGGESSDFPSENESHSEFSTIVEESQDEDKENKDKPACKLRTAAGNMINTWKRRSKRWRKSFDSDSEKAVADDLDNQLTKGKNDNTKPLENLSETNNILQSTATNSEKSEDYSNLSCEAIDGKSQKDLQKEANCSTERTTTNNHNTPRDISLRGRSSKEFLICTTESERPKSLFLPSRKDINKENLSDNRVVSDGNIPGEMPRLPSPVWVRMKDGHRVVNRTASESGLKLLVRSRRSSIASSDAGSPLSTSRGSLLDTSQDSLDDSGVSTENSPTNTLTSRRKKRVSKSLSLVNNSGESSRKLIQFNRRSWGEWVATEMEQTPATCTEYNEDTTGEYSEPAKSQNAFKRVVKQLFSAKKRQNTSHISKVLPVTATPSPEKHTFLQKAKTEKISTV